MEARYIELVSTPGNGPKSLDCVATSLNALLIGEKSPWIRKVRTREREIYKFWYEPSRKEVFSTPKSRHRSCAANEKETLQIWKVRTRESRFKM